MPSLSLSIGVMSFLNFREERVASASLPLGPTTTPWDPPTGVWLKMPPIKQLEFPFVVEKVSPIEKDLRPPSSRYRKPPPAKPPPMVKACTTPASLTLMPPDGKLVPMRIVLDSPAVPATLEPMEILPLSLPV